ncbi:MAG: DUF4266 domain-containing protein [Archangiaceae bacterium]|nr:DUF4266 domain-containing protein [Archangiaceae bacterium]
MTLRVLAAAAVLLAESCTTVSAVQRGRLMQRAMQAKPALDGAFDGHVEELREAALGASAGENASCGCR